MAAAADPDPNFEVPDSNSINGKPIHSKRFLEEKTFHLSSWTRGPSWIQTLLSTRTRATIVEANEDDDDDQTFRHNYGQFCGNCALLGEEPSINNQKRAEIAGEFQLWRTKFIDDPERNYAVEVVSIDQRHVHAAGNNNQKAHTTSAAILT